MSEKDQPETKLARAALYIDGFNLYHAIDRLGQPHLKWLSYWRLGQGILPQRTQKLVRVVYCTAFYPGSAGKRWRHEQVIAAQRAEGVEVALGHYVHERMLCRNCGDRWEKPTEKAGDINLAIHLMHDAFEDVFDHAYLLTADSDQAATAAMFARRFPEKRLTTVAPPGRDPSVHILRHASGGKIKLNAGHLERAVMGAVVGKARRPDEYAPPEG